jgi:hypothetical protein
MSCEPPENSTADMRAASPTRGDHALPSNRTNAGGARRSCDCLVTPRDIEGTFGSDQADDCSENAVQVVPPTGFEPAAFCSGGRRSIP